MIAQNVLALPQRTITSAKSAALMCEHTENYRHDKGIKQCPSLAQMWREVYAEDVTWVTESRELQISILREKKEVAIVSSDFELADKLRTRERILLEDIHNSSPGERIALADCGCCGNRESMEISDYICLWCRWYELHP